MTQALLATALPVAFDLHEGSWHGRLESLLSQGQAAGADLVELFIERTDNLGVLAEQDTITNVSPVPTTSGCWPNRTQLPM